MTTKKILWRSSGSAILLDPEERSGDEMEFLDRVDGRDLLITFAVATIAGFLFYYADQLLLAKVETAVGIPAGTF